MTAYPPAIRLFIDLSDGISRTYEVSRYVIEAGVLRLYAADPSAAAAAAGTEAGLVEPRDGERPEIEVAAFAVGGWLRVERDLPATP